MIRQVAVKCRFKNSLNSGVELELNFVIVCLSKDNGQGTECVVWLHAVHLKFEVLRNNQVIEREK